METKDHYRLARFLAKNMRIDKRKRMAFIMGNLTPDWNPFSYLSGLEGKKMLGHTYDYRQAYFDSQLKRKRKDTFAWWYRLGQMIHFLTDSFTAPHNEIFAFGLKEHVQYEHRLHEYFSNQLYGLSTWENGSTEIGERFGAQWISQLHDTYMESPISVENDWHFIIYAVVSICQMFGGRII